MQAPVFLRRISRWPAWLLGGTLWLQASFFLGAQPFQVGQIVTTNFGLVTRFRWTNDNGQVFTPGNTTFRLSDFAGKIVMFEFFAVW